jgi:hypothetical protein
MQTETVHQTGILWRSDLRPDVTTDEHELARVIAWADQHPHAWDIVTHQRSKAFGIGSCVYIGWAQRSMAPEAILERAAHLHRFVVGIEPHLSPNHLQCWSARHTFQHYRDRGFTGGYFQQHDASYPRISLTLDYTPETLPEVVQGFLRWSSNLLSAARVTVDGKTVWEKGEGHG